MKKILIIIISSLLVIVGIIVINYPEEELKSKTNIIDKQNTLGILLETSSGSGEYQESNSDAYPTDGYTFNSELSKCENGGQLSWDSDNNQVVFRGRASDKCYIYFDKD